MSLKEIVFARIFVALATFLLLSVAQGSTKIIGNKVNETAAASGPAAIYVDLDTCKFGMTLSRGEHIKYNGPDVVLYLSNKPLDDIKLPHLHQAPISSGYDWWFEGDRRSVVPWIGLMCADKSEFVWDRDAAETDSSQQLQEIREANTTKCPAYFDGQSWNVTSKSGDFFKKIVLGDARGFVTNKSGESRKNKYENQTILFCFKMENSVLIGVAAGGFTTATTASSSAKSIFNILMDFKFEPQ